MIRLYVTFDGLKDLEPMKYEKFAGNLQMVWSNVKDDAGQVMKGNFYSNRAKLFENITLRKGNRYVVECKEVRDKKIYFPTSISNTNKNPRCNLIRKVADDYTFIRGKHKGKWLSKLASFEKDEIKRYLLWLGKNTNNEATVNNVLCMLKIIDDEQI